MRFPIQSTGSWTGVVDGLFLEPVPPANPWNSAGLQCGTNRRAQNGGHPYGLNRFSDLCLQFSLRVRVSRTAGLAMPDCDDMIRPLEFCGFVVLP